MWDNLRELWQGFTHSLRHIISPRNLEINPWAENCFVEKEVLGLASHHRWQRIYVCLWATRPRSKRESLTLSPAQEEPLKTYIDSSIYGAAQPVKLTEKEGQQGNAKSHTTHHAEMQSGEFSIYSTGNIQAKLLLNVPASCDPWTVVSSLSMRFSGEYWCYFHYLKNLWKHPQQKGSLGYLFSYLSFLETSPWVTEQLQMGKASRKQMLTTPSFQRL